MRQVLGRPFKVVVIIAAFALGFWAFVLELAIVSEVAGFWGIVVGLLFAPVVFAAAPWYAGVHTGKLVPAHPWLWRADCRRAVVRIGLPDCR